MKWEYAVHDSAWKTPLELELFLNRIGADGWEVFHVGTIHYEHHAVGLRHSAHIYAKRVHEAGDGRLRATHGQQI